MTALFIIWDIDPEIIRIGEISLRYYGLLFVCGLILTGWVLKQMLPGSKLGIYELERFSIFAIIGVFVGARLGHCLFYEPAYYLHRPLEIILPIAPDAHGTWHFIGYQGLASHGGVIGMIIALLLYAYKSKTSFIYIIDMVAVVAPLAGCFIRLANLMNSEIIGSPTNVPWAFIFVREDMIPRHPAQLYEALAYLLIFLFNLFFLYRRHKDMIGTGFFTGWTSLLVFTMRFFIEFIKERQVAFEYEMALDMGQWLSLPFIFAGILMIVLSLQKRRSIHTYNTSLRAIAKQSHNNHRDCFGASTSQ